MQPAQQMQLAGQAVIASDSFEFDPAVKPKLLSAVAERPTSRGRVLFRLPAAELVVGEEVPGLSGLSGGGVSVTRMQPSPEQLELSR